MGSPVQGQSSGRSAQDALKGVDLGLYEPISILGQGSFGTVFRAQGTPDNGGIEVAIKLLPRGEFIKNFKTYVKREIVHQSSLRHPFIVGLREVFLTQEHLALVMDYAAGGNMFQYIQRHPARCLTEVQALWMFQQTIIATDFCHKLGVANRDLKLENMLLDCDGSTGRRPMIKICDFGYSKHTLNSSAKTGVGTATYMAPEVIYGGPRYDAKKADTWACGVILYTMLYGCYPFSNTEPDYLVRISRADYEIPPEVPVSTECLDLLTRILVADPERRLSMTAIQTHPWFRIGLPKGTEDMNRFYAAQCTAPEQLSQVMEGPVDAIVQLACNRGSPGDPPVGIKF
mmetsp:Transcript_10857/g.32543  ORF Transcript_10857/g.32543 Transcript_10857/m.32543 type:complete len:344 (+) Transcript_10857:974-2005(+)